MRNKNTFQYDAYRPRQWPYLGGVSGPGELLLGGGGCLLQGVSAPGGVCPRGGVCSRGVAARVRGSAGGCLLWGGWSCPGGLVWGLSAPGGVSPLGGCLLKGGVVSRHALRQTPPPHVDRQMPVKT